MKDNFFALRGIQTLRIIAPTCVVNLAGVAGGVCVRPFENNLTTLIYFETLMLKFTKTGLQFKSSLDTSPPFFSFFFFANFVVVCFPF
jgi:hypothetical protein